VSDQTNEAEADATRPAPPVDAPDVVEALETLPRRRDQLLPALIAAEHALGWLSEAAIEDVSVHTRIPLSEVYATATAYSELRLEPPVEGRWHVCTGVTCRQAGADALLDALAGSGESAEPVDCRFLCALAPVAERGGALFGRCEAQRLIALAVEDGDRS
jgi:NADH:ubiquinone oxidoreductase subunit E|tara:strand:- start:77 stop:556 length:480 start_codon:yes stop_codon:yes gene_type:complete